MSWRFLSISSMSSRADEGYKLMLCMMECYTSGEGKDGEKERNINGVPRASKLLVYYVAQAS